jgi:hypothetical protein
MILPVWELRVLWGYALLWMCRVSLPGGFLSIRAPRGDLRLVGELVSMPAECTLRIESAPSGSTHYAEEQRTQQRLIEIVGELRLVNIQIELGSGASAQ